MKKYSISLLCIASLIFFSCASTPDETSSSNEEEITSPAETVETTELNSETSEDSQNSDTTDEEIILVSDTYPELEDINDPEITDLEYIEENFEISNETSPDSEEDISESVELVPAEEILPQTETSVTQNEELTLKTDNNIDNSKNDSQTSLTEQNNEDIDEVIDLENSDSINIDDIENETQENIEPEIKIIEPSRKVTLKIGQLLEVSYPGSGWVFMGATDNSKDLSFLGKKLGTENTKFSFSAKTSGTKILHFYKNDSLTGKWLDDYLEVTILSEKDSSKALIVAPSYKQPVPKKAETPKKTEEVKTVVETSTENKAEKSSENTKVKEVSKISDQEQTSGNKNENKTASKVDSTYTETKNPVPENVREILIEAQKLYDNKQYKQAVNKLNQFFEYSTDNRDEALFLQGQIYEANSEIKNIKKAIESYKMLTSNYPASFYWDDANKRIIYLTKFYLEGR